MVERWAAAVGWPGYEVSDLGRVKSLQRVLPHNRYPGKTMVWKEKILKPGKQKSGHLFVVLTGQVAVRVHILVATAFLGPPPYPNALVRHWDDDPANNVDTNLRWGNQVDNMRDAARNGKIPRGRKRPNAKLHPKDIPFIRASKLNLSQLARKFAVSAATIRDVKTGRSWSHI